MFMLRALTTPPKVFLSEMSLSHAVDGLRSSAIRRTTLPPTSFAPAWSNALLSGEPKRQIANVRREIRDCNYEIAVDFQGALKSAAIARLSGAGTIFGMANPREAPARIFYNRRVATEGAHVIEQYHS